MSPTRTSRGQPSTWVAESRLYPYSEFHPNSWNVNHMNAFQYAKLLESITEYGFTDPILARTCVLHGDLEIIGGKHRWNAAGDLGLTELPAVVKDMDDRTARKLSLIDNELHGQADPKALGDLLKDLLEGDDVEDMLKGLPYTDDILKSLTGFSSLPPLPAALLPPTGDGLLPDTGGSAVEKWVERTYRMPADVAAVIDDALTKAKAELKAQAGTDIGDFQALEVIAAEYLAS
jgi:ParB-like chromosome segregation protein Spo0J